MSDNKRIRRPSSEVLPEKIKKQEDKIARLKEQLANAEAKLEVLKNPKPVSSRIKEPTLSARITKYPEYRKEYITALSVEDDTERMNQLKKLWSKIESEQSKTE